MDNHCPQRYVIPHGAKVSRAHVYITTKLSAYIDNFRQIHLDLVLLQQVFVTAFLLASQLSRPRRAEKKCKSSDDEIPNDKGLMDLRWKLAPYKYNLSRDPPASSLELLMMRSRREYEKVNPPKIPEPELNFRIHYDYGKIYKRIKL